MGKYVQFQQAPKHFWAQSAKHVPIYRRRRKAHYGTQHFITLLMRRIIRPISREIPNEAELLFTSVLSPISFMNKMAHTT